MNTDDVWIFSIAIGVFGMRIGSVWTKSLLLQGAHERPLITHVRKTLSRYAGIVRIH